MLVMLRTERAALAGVAALVAASCTFFAPLDGLSGHDAPDADEAAVSADVVEGGAPAEAAPLEAAGDAPPDAAEAGADYAATVFADSPLAYWRLDETSGTVCRDSTVNHNDATYQGAVTLGVAGALANDPAVQFDGNSAQILVGDKFGFVGTVPMSIEMWAKPDVIDGNFRHLETKMGFDASQPSDGMYFYVVTGAKPLGFERWANGGTDNGLKGYVARGSWWHIVGTFDGTNLRLYVNGMLQSSQPSGLALVANGVPLLWGQLFQGALDELAIYDHALSDARIQAHYMAAQ
jgi:hypothetical protein